MTPVTVPPGEAPILNLKGHSGGDLATKASDESLVSAHRFQFALFSPRLWQFLSTLPPQRDRDSGTPLKGVVPASVSLTSGPRLRQSSCRGAEVFAEVSNKGLFMTRDTLFRVGSSAGRPPFT